MNPFIVGFPSDVLANVKRNNLTISIENSQYVVRNEHGNVFTSSDKIWKIRKSLLDAFGVGDGPNLWNPNADAVAEIVNKNSSKQSNFNSK